MTATRDIGPLLQKFRALLLGRTHMNNLRFDHLQAPRTVPEPNMPPGPSHLLNTNYYYARSVLVLQYTLLGRDGRREVALPTVLADPQKALGSGGEAVPAPSAMRTPGRVQLISDMKAGDI
jgi:NADH dehydrogenase (ubiquinone) 1 alpha subcomplex subunit 7